MSAAKKADTQKKIVIGLAAVFLIAMVKNLGLVRLPVAGSSKPMGESVNMTKTLSQTFADHWNEVNQGFNALTGQAAPPVAPKSTLIYSAQNLRDPLASLLPKPAPAPTVPEQQAVIEEAKPPEPPPQIVIKGIWWEGGQPKALINNAIYGVGESIGGARITAIARDGVTLEFHGEVLHASIPSALSR